MFDHIFRLLDEMDSFKKVALFLLTGMSALLIYFGYRSIETYDVWVQWNSVPKILYTELPCSLVQIRSDVYLVSIPFPRPVSTIDHFTSSFWVPKSLSPDDFTGMCKSLIKAINSNEAEKVLAPYLDNSP